VKRFCDDALRNRNEGAKKNQCDVEFPCRVRGGPPGKKKRGESGKTLVGRKKRKKADPSHEKKIEKKKRKDAER